MENLTCTVPFLPVATSQTGTRAVPRYRMQSNFERREPLAVTTICSRGSKRALLLHLCLGLHVVFILLRLN